MLVRRRCAGGTEAQRTNDAPVERKNKHPPRERIGASKLTVNA